MPQLSAFPKAFLDELCISGTMSVPQWIELAATLDIDGLEFYSDFLDLRDEKNWEKHARLAADHNLKIPMLCCSPDFTHPDAAFRREQVEREKHWIEMAAGLGAQYCRVLSGQRRPEVSREAGIAYAAESIHACLPHAASCGVTLILENHYKDHYWQFPEFAQRMDVFCELVDQIHAPNFGINFDPSNTLLAGEDPLELLERVKDRVLTMHASDRYLTSGTMEDLRREEDVFGYAARLKHGVIGQGLNDYDAIFSTLKNAGFNGWISIEDGENGMEELQKSVAFLREKINCHWQSNA